jgi:hypothetical protein
MSLLNKIIIILVLALGLLLRLYKLNNPVADWHSHRQADTASVTKIFDEHGVDFFLPHYHDLSDVQSGQENPQGYRLVELPIYNLISVYFHKIFGTNIDVSSRFVSIIFSLGSGLLIFFICFDLTHTFAPSLFSLIIFLVLPFNVYYSRTILPEPSAVFFMLLALYLFSKNILLSGFAFAIAILLKPYTALILFPFLITNIFIRKSYFLHLKSIFLLLMFSLISLTPFIAWRLWISHFPEGIPSSGWLLNNEVSRTFPDWLMGINISFLNKLVAFRPHWWRWLFYERISNLILGSFGLIPLFLGFVYKKNHTQKVMFSFFAGIMLYFIIVAQGNIQHDYYQTLIIPFIAIISGVGYYYILKFTFSSTLTSIIFIMVIFSFTMFFSWDKIGGYYQINNSSIVNAGLVAKRILPEGSLVIAPYVGDTAFLYQTGFSGWPTEMYDVPHLVTEYPGKHIYLISVNFDTYTNLFISKHPTIYRNNDFIILKLSP